MEKKCYRCRWIFVPESAFKIYQIGRERIRLCEPCYNDMLYKRRNIIRRRKHSQATQMELFVRSEFLRRNTDGA